jgi:hypothetical protein
MWWQARRPIATKTKRPASDAQASAGDSDTTARGELALDGGVVVDRMRSCKGDCGLDAVTGKYVDLIEAGIVIPLK